VNQQKTRNVGFAQLMKAEGIADVCRFVARQSIFDWFRTYRGEALGAE
jgi:hypothetical protein